MSGKGKVALVAGFWGQNIGNAFFNLGGKWILEQVFRGYRVEFIQDQPGYRTPGYAIWKRQENPKNDLGLLKHIEADYLVLQGPMLTVNFRRLWEDTFRRLHEKGTKIILLSAAMFQYTSEEIALNRQFLREYPPYIICTRDSRTYEAFKDCATFTYNGIDSAFFVPEVYEPFHLDIEPFVCVNFDRYPEPAIYLESEARRRRPSTGMTKDFVFMGRRWHLEFPAVPMYFSRLGQWQAYIGALMDCRRLPLRVGDYLIVRPEHRFTPYVTWKIYRQKNAIVSDEPFTYLTLYGRTSLTLSDRVHACVVTLAYGKPAMLFTPTPRASLFHRVGAERIQQEPVTLDMDRLREEKEAQLRFLKAAVSSG